MIKKGIVLKLIEDNVPIREDRYHMILSITDHSGHDIGFDHKFTHREQLDPLFKSEYGAVPYSQELHEIINELVKEGFVERGPDDPLLLKYKNW